MHRLGFWRPVALAWLVLACVSSSAATAQDYPISPVPFTDVRITDDFWTPRMEIHRQVTVPYCFQRCEETGRIDNFAVAGGLKEGKYRGARYNDSDVYKVIEGAAYSLAIHPDPKLDAYLDGVIEKIAAAQEDDGYLSTLRTITPELDINKTFETPQHQLDMYGAERWARCDHGHELYCVGHMYEAAVAHYLATGKRSLLDVALKSAELVCRVFGPDAKRDVPGHEEIEIALVKLFRLTGETKYLDMAKFFLDERGHYNGRTVHTHNEIITYAQDHKPVIEQTEPTGHVVRAMYLYCGMADAAAITGDRDYVKAIDRIWNDVVFKKLYLNGSMGVRGYAEGFGLDYMLPNHDAFCETCASVGNAMWNHRLFLLHGDAKYIDVLERDVYNAILASFSMEGNRFFYSNPMASDGVFTKNVRREWFKTACCPSNIARFMPSLPGYAYAHADNDLYVNLFIAGTASVALAGRTVEVTQKTDYPWDGQVKIEVSPDTPGEFDLLVRIPGWARDRPVPSDLYRFMHDADTEAALKVNGRAVGTRIDKGYVRLHRQWKAGDVVTLNLPMPVRRVLTHPKVADNVGRVAIQRGPIVYCAEWKDNGGRALDLVLADDMELAVEHREDLLGGVMAVTGRNPNGETLTLIPYYAWARRGLGEMAVWLARTWQPYLASRVHADATLSALGEEAEPKDSCGVGMPEFFWGTHRNRAQWVQRNFREPQRVESVEVYWLDDEPLGGNQRVPTSWKVLYRDREGWKPVSTKSKPGTVRDQYNEATFEPVTATALRLDVRLQPDFSAGLLRWKVK